MTSYAPVGQVTSFFSKQLSLTDRIPWIYAIVSLSHRLVCVGETFSDGGLLSEMSSQLTAPESVLQTKCVELGIARLSSSYLIVAARLPSDRDPAGFDGSSATVRMHCATTLQSKMVQQFIPDNPGWTDVSMTTGAPASAGTAIDDACSAIFSHVSGSIHGMSALSRSVPLHVILLDPYPVAAHESNSIEEALTEIELKLHDFVVGQLKTSFPGAWWPQIPLSVRRACADRREEDGGDHAISPDAYMMFIDFVDISKSNWQLIGPFMERVAGRQGKDAATGWIKEMNQIRKVWAHPIRGKYIPLEPGSRERVLDVRRRLIAACEAAAVSIGSEPREQDP